MAKVQIDEDIFLLLYQKYCNGVELDTIQNMAIKHELDDKMNRILSRTFYSEYKNANEEDKQKTLDTYLLHKKGLIQ